MKLKLPESYILILMIIILASVASYILPAGEYVREYNSELNIEQVIEGSYHTVESNPVSLSGFLNSITKGLMDASELIIFVLIIGGSFGIISATGVIDNYVQSLITGYEGKEKLIIFKVMFLFSIGGVVFGMAEETLPFYPIFIMMALAMKFDKLTGMAIVMVGSIAGFTAGVINPFTTGLAQNIAGLPLFSGALIRVLAYVLFFSTGFMYVYKHAMKVRKLGVVEEYDYMAFDTHPEGVTTSNKRVAFVVLISVIGLAFGIYKFKFTLTEMATVFLVMGVLAGIAGRLKSGRIISEFTAGASNLVYGAMIIGLARAVMVVLQSGHILDTIIYGLSSLIGTISPAISAVIMFFVQGVLNVFIASGTGQATMTMPIMIGIADLANITRQTSVLAFQFGDGLINIITPTSGVLMAALTISDIDYKKWIKWILPLLIIWIIEGCAILVLSCIINYGPF